MMKLLNTRDNNIVLVLVDMLRNCLSLSFSFYRNAEAFVCE